MTFDEAKLEPSWKVALMMVREHMDSYTSGSTARETIKKLAEEMIAYDADHQRFLRDKCGTIK